jgi:hypothetical protein
MADSKQNPETLAASGFRETDQAGERVYREYKENHSAGQYRLITTVPKSARQEFRIGIRDYNGTPKIEIRIWERDGLGVWQQTPRRMAIGRGPIAAVIAGLCECEARL